MSKYDLSQLSIIFSVKIDSEDRLKNLIWNLKYYETYFNNYEIIIVEQDERSRINKFLKTFHNIIHYFIPSKGAHYKTRNLNYATNLSSREFIMMCDCDVLCPVDCLIEALDKLRRGVCFLSPHNGLLVEIKKSFLSQSKDIKEILSKTAFFPKDFNLHLKEFDFSIMTPLYGSSYYDSTGGCILYRRKEFYLIGGWNTNFISYGFEDMEFAYRIHKLGYCLEKLENYNIYHLEHIRHNDSMYNNYYRSNEVEWLTISNMSESELRAYALNNFKKIILCNKKEISIINSEQEFSIKVLDIDKTDLDDLTIILPLCVQDLSNLYFLNIFVTYLELYYKNYELIMIEGESRNCKYLSNKKNTKYIWLGLDELNFSHAIEVGISNSTKNLIAIWDFFTLINPSQLIKSIELLRNTGRTRQLKDCNWYLRGIKKTKKGTGVTLFKNN